MNFKEYNGEDPNKYLYRKTIFIIGHTSSCGNCVIAKSKTEILARSHPDVMFVFWDMSKFDDLSLLVPDFYPMAFPYVRSYYNHSCIRGRYSAEIYILEDMINELNKVELEIRGWGL